MTDTPGAVVIVTAIGSVSGPFVVQRLKALGHNVIGVNSPTRTPPPAAHFCDVFRTITHSADESRYVEEILGLAELFRADFVLPLTDPESFLLSQARGAFGGGGVSVACSSADSLSRVRDKLNLAREACLLDLDRFSVIPTFTGFDDVIDEHRFPIVRKPRIGRSSQGMRILTSAEHCPPAGPDAIYQPFIDGWVVTVDAWRSADSESRCCSRVELVRSRTGLGLAVTVFDDPALAAIASALLEHFAISGLVNIEFIRQGGRYFLMDFNLRASAGLGFSYRAGVDFLEHVFRRQPDPPDTSNLCSTAAGKIRPLTTL